MLVLLLALPALRADDKPKDAPKAQYDALVGEFAKQKADIIAEYPKTKGEEQQKLLMKYRNLGTDFADKFYKVAENNPKDPIATEALFWVVQNAPKSSVYPKATEKVTALVKDMPLKDLASRFNPRLASGPVVFPPAFLEATFKRVEKDPKDPKAADLLAALAVNRGSPDVSQKATELLIDKFPDHKGIEQICLALSYSESPKAADTLKVILEKSSEPRVQTAAAIGLARALAGQLDELGNKPEQADKVAAEAEKYLGLVIDKYGKDNPAQLKEAQRSLKALKTLRVGKEAPNITAVDLDEKEFKLSDYRGKVVLLDFWGNW
jgi:hypothetical protein